MKPIEEVEIGDLVWAWDEKAHMLVKRGVKRLFRRRDRSVIRVLMADQAGNAHTIDATTRHPFWIEGRGWVAAADLANGDVLKRVDGEPGMEVQRVINRCDKANVFNFEVEAVHNYFVGEVGLLVHNESLKKNRDARIGTPDEVAFDIVRREVESSAGNWNKLDQLPVIDRISRPADAGAYRSPVQLRDVKFTKLGLRRSSIETESTLSRDFVATTPDWRRHVIGHTSGDIDSGQLTLNLNNIQEVGGQTVKLKGDGFSITREALITAVDAYNTKFGRLPEDLGGGLRDKNLQLFEEQFLLAREMLPDASRQTISEIALRRISFGSARVDLGYTDFYTGPGDQTLWDIRGREYPKVPMPINIEVRAGPGAEEVVKAILDSRSQAG